MTEGSEAVVGIALRIDELAAKAGVSVRTIRFYSAKGLLPPPEIGERRVGRYGAAHLARLELIRALQAQGFTLTAIERHLERIPDGAGPEDFALHKALMAPWIQPEPEL